MRRLLILLALCGAAAAQDQGKRQDPAQAHPKVDQDAVDRAIERGVRFLKGRVDGLPPIKSEEVRGHRYHELVLWTFVHAGVPESDGKFQTLLRHILEEPLERTYLVSLQAMILEELDPAKYQIRLAQCAQFLVDNQCENGQWSYGEPVMMPEGLDVPTTGGRNREDVATKGGDGGRAPARSRKTVPTRRIPVKKRRVGPAYGDNSNSQYASLGLRACADARIVIEPTVLKRARTWWEIAQKQDGGWCYGGDNGFKSGHLQHESYGSMTAGAVGSVLIYNYLLGKRGGRNEKHVRKGLEWIAKNFSVRRNPGRQEHKPEDPTHHYYYYMYALERAGLLGGGEFFGPNEWYPLGANHLLRTQEKGGRWGKGVVDTCFAILFLRRATRPLEKVATKSGGDSKRR